MKVENTERHVRLQFPILVPTLDTDMLGCLIYLGKYLERKPVIFCNKAH